VQVLPEAWRALLAVAAVAGRVAARRLLLAVLDQPEQVVAEGLDGVCGRGLMQAVGEDAYGFVHDVIQEVVAGDLGPASRRLLHRQVAVALEEQAGPVSVEALAYHFRQAGEAARAVPYLEQAGDQAAAHFAYAAAAEHYRELVRCLEGLGLSFDLARANEKLGEAHFKLAQYQAALAALERAAAHARTANDLDGLARVETQIAWVHYYRGSSATGMARLQPVAATLEATGPSPGLAQLYDALGSLYQHEGQYEQALAAGERAAATARGVGAMGTLAMQQSRAGVELLFLSRADEALQAEEEAVRLAEEADDAGAFCQALSLRSLIYEELGEYDQERRDAERALALTEQVGILRAMFCMLRLGAVAFFTGDWPRAHSWCEKVLALADEVGLSEGWQYAGALQDFGRLRLAEGAWEEATRYLEASLAAYQERANRSLQLKVQCLLAERDVLTGDPAAACARLLPLLDPPGREEWDVTQYLLPVLAWAELALGEVEQAAATVADAVRRARQGPCRLGLVNALCVQAMVLLAQQRREEATQSLEEGLAVARRLPYPQGEGRLLEVYGRLHLASGRAASARERLEAALAIFRRLGARKDAERVELLLAAYG
jgi:tetratricopeptide (TPR) repeat protein